MVNSRLTTKVFAFFFLIFASFTISDAQDSVFELAAGTRIKVRMDAEVSSNVARVDDTFTTTVTEPISIRGTVVVPTGTVVEGRVTRVAPASGNGKNGVLEVVFETIKFANGSVRKIESTALTREKPANSALSLLSIIGGTATGAVIGGAAKSGVGALIGAGIGAGAGTGIALARKGKEARIRTDEKFELQLKSAVTLPVSDY